MKVTHCKNDENFKALKSRLKNLVFFYFVLLFRKERKKVRRKVREKEPISKWQNKKKINPNLKDLDHES